MTLEELQDRYADFVAKRDWNQFHTPQNLAQALSVEANELLENFLWMNNPSSEEIAADEELKGDIEEEMADVLLYLLGLATQLDIDLLVAVEQKLDDNESRFDPEKSAEITAFLENWQ